MFPSIFIHMESKDFDESPGTSDESPGTSHKTNSF